MTDDHAQRRTLDQDPEQHEADDEATTPEAGNDPPVAPTERRDSEQAQANLDRMLETGEENPIS